MTIMNNRLRFTCLLVGASMTLTLAGCSSLNPFSSKKLPVNVPAALTEFKQTIEPRSIWSINVGNAENYEFVPALTYDSIVAASAAGTIVKVNPDNGHEIWRINADVRLTAGVGSDGSTIAVAGEKGVILTFDQDGKLRWKTQVSSEVLSAPVVGQGLVVVRSQDNRIAAYDAYSGARKWIVTRTAPPLTLRSAPGMLIDNSEVIVAMPGGRLLGLALNNGGPLWEIAVGDPRGATELDRIADVSGYPVIYNRQACAVAYHGRVGCINLATGSPQWSRMFSSDVGLGIDERNVYASSDKGSVSAFALQGGQSVWLNDKLAYRQLTAPVALKRAIAVGDGMGFVHFLDKENGALIGRMNTDGSPILSTPLASGGKLIIQTRAGTLMAVTADNG